jgi:excisionase family DNA binding protein
MTDELMNIQEVARYLRVPVPTIRWLRQEGRFAPAMKVGRRLVWDLADVREWAEKQRERSLA